MFALVGWMDDWMDHIDLGSGRMMAVMTRRLCVNDERIGGRR